MSHPRHRNVVKAYRLMWAQKYTFNKRERSLLLQFKMYKCYKS